MPLGTENEQTAEVFHLFVFGIRCGVSSELDVHTAAGHVGSYSDRGTPACLRDDLPLPLMVLRVQDLVRYPLLLEVCREKFVLLDRDSADEYGLALRVEFFHAPRNCLELPRFALENKVFMVLALRGFIGRYGDGVKPVHLEELLRGGQCGTCHSCELLVEAEVILERDGSEGTALLLHGHALFRFDGLMQAVAPAPPWLEAAGELVNNDYLTIPHHILFVALVERFGAHSRFEMMH